MFNLIYQLFFLEARKDGSNFHLIYIKQQFCPTNEKQSFHKEVEKEIATLESQPDNALVTNRVNVK